MRHIIFDTETTGLSFEDDRITEGGFIETIDFVPTGRILHFYCNPKKHLSAKITEITGLTDKFLSDKKDISYFLPKVIDFIEDSPLVAHNSDFDRKMLNAELSRARMPVIEEDRFIDTLAMSRELFPGKKHTLDALCSRLGIQNKDRDVHSAIYDSLILCEAFKAMNFMAEELDLEIKKKRLEYYSARQRLNPIRSISEEDITTHKKFCSDNNFYQWNKIYRSRRVSS